MGAFPHIQYAALSDLGRKRKNNEDSFGTFPSVGVFCVADGMGGGDDGEVASAATVRAVETFAEKNPLPQNATFPVDSYVEGLCEAVNAASEWIFHRTQEKNLKGCGSTFVGVCLDAANPGEAVALHAGDSRLYRIRGRTIQQITKDHSAAELIGAKDESEVNPMFRGMILRAVGIQSSVEIDRTGFAIKEGDRILICSDGLSRMVPDKRILAICRENTSSADACQKLIAAANDAGGIDNVTVVLVDVGPLPKPLPVSAVAIKAPTVDRVSNDARTDENPSTSDTENGLSAAFDSDSAESFIGTSASDAPSGGGEAVAFTSSTVSDSTGGSTASSGLPKAANQAGADQTDRDSACKRKNRSKIILVVGVALGLIGMLGFFLVRSATEKQGVAENGLMDKRRIAAEEEAKRVAEEKRLADEKRVAEETRRAEEEAKRVAEEKRLAEEKRIADEKRKAEETRRAEEEAKRVAEEKRLAEEKRIADEKRKAEETRRAEEEAKRVAEEKRLAEEKRIAEERRLAEKQKKDSERHAKQVQVVAGLKAACNVEFVAKFRDKLQDLGIEKVPEALYGHLEMMGDLNKGDEEKLACAEMLTKEMQLVAKELLGYADLLEESDFEVAGNNRNRESVRQKVTAFRVVANRLISGDPADPTVQRDCAELIYMLPKWF